MLRGRITLTRGSTLDLPESRAVPGSHTGDVVGRSWRKRQCLHECPGRIPGEARACSFRSAHSLSGNLMAAINRARYSMLTRENKAA